MQGKSHSVAPAPGTLGSGAVAVRDKMRSLHLGKKEERETRSQDSVNVRDAVCFRKRIPFDRTLGAPVS